MKKKILTKERRYTFSDYFDLNNPTDEIVEELGYSFSYEVLDLPRSNNYNVLDVKRLQDTFYTIYSKVIINSEIAKREFLIAPILVELAKNTDSKINVEYPIEVNDKLCGSLDYLIRSRQELIVIEAKKGDLDKGFTQLSAELIALDKYEGTNVGKILYGAITIGDVWKFGLLDRCRQHITKDIDSYAVPGNLETILSILVGIVTS